MIPSMSSQRGTMAVLMLFLWMVVVCMLPNGGCDAFCARSINNSPVASTMLSPSSTRLHMEPAAASLYTTIGETSTTTAIASTSSSSSIQVSAATLDPTTILSDIFSGILGTPLILAVPIVAALGVASLIAWFIVSYASPVVEDDE